MDRWMDGQTSLIRFFECSVVQSENEQVLLQFGFPVTALHSALNLITNEFLIRFYGE